MFPSLNISLQDCKVLSDSRFSELCSVLGVREQCCFAPDRKLIEKAFRKTALKCHPDKGGDPVVFKKLNDAYLRLMGHIRKVIFSIDILIFKYSKLNFFALVFHKNNLLNLKSLQNTFIFRTIYSLINGFVQHISSLTR